MTLESMRWHEAVNIHYDTDFRRQSLLQLVRRYVKGPAVLDMRCITGTLTAELAAEGLDVVALDGYQGAVDKTNTRARERGVEKTVAHLWDLERLPEAAAGRQFDTVLCVDVLNHVPDDITTMELIGKALIPGGRLVVVAPAFPGLLGNRDRSLGHLRRYSRAGLRALLERSGLQVREMRFWNFLALPLYMLIERGLNAKISDGMRFGWAGRKGSMINSLLTWWYKRIENNWRSPFGLTLIAASDKPKSDTEGS